MAPAPPRRRTTPAVTKTLAAVFAVVLCASTAPLVQAGCPSGSSLMSNSASTYDIKELCKHSDNCYDCTSWCKNYNWYLNYYGDYVYCGSGYSYMYSNNYVTRIKKTAFSSSEMPKNKVLSSWYGKAKVTGIYARTLDQTVEDLSNEVIAEISYDSSDITSCQWCCATINFNGVLAGNLVTGVEGWTRGEDFKIITHSTNYAYLNTLTMYWCYSTRVCGAGEYMDSSNNCQLCPAGRYRTETGGSGVSSCTKCPAGRFGSQTGETNSQCEGPCQPGFYCVSGSSTERAKQCPAGRYGNAYGNTNSNCNGPCTAGYYCVPGSTSATPQLCRAGYYGVSGGTYLDSTCKGKCSAGYYCNAGSSSATQYACPSSDKSVYCPAGSAEPEAVSDGYKAVSGQTAQEPCAAGKYCRLGVERNCPVGKYGSASGMFASSCSGECTPGYFCKAGSKSSRAEKCAETSAAPSICRSGSPELCYCPAGTESVQILSTAERSTHYTIPESAPAERREDKASCPPGSVCEDGVQLPSMEWANCADGATMRFVDETPDGASFSSTDVGTAITSTHSGAEYSLTSVTRPSGCSDGAFSVDDATGQVTLTSSVNYEDCPYFVVRITASDSLDSITCDVTVNVNDLNDRPTIDNCGNREVEETAGELANIGNEFVVNDPDKGQTGTWKIKTISPDEGNIKINPCTGQLQVREATLNYESQQSYALTLEVTDDGKPSIAATCDMTIHVQDANDPPTLDDASATVSEGASAGHTVMTLSGSDPEGKALSYRISKDDPSGVKAFTMTSGGAIKVAAAATGGTYLNYEDRLRWVLVAEAIDDGGLKATAEITITVTDANDKPKMGAASMYVLESQSSGTFGDQLTGEDEDAGEAASLKFYIDSSAGSLPFSLSTSGVFSVSSSLNYEAKSTYSFPVYAQDARSLKSDTATVTITVGDVNEQPSFTLGSYSLSVSESAEIGTSVGAALSATDPDNLQTLVFSILPPTSGLDGTAFFDVGALTGQVTLKKAVDYEAMSSPFKYFFRVQVKDNHGSPLTAITTVEVAVTNANEPPSVTAGQTRSIPEGSDAGTSIGAPIVASDPDKATFEGGADPTFAISAGNDDGAFSITSSGQLKVAKSTALDYERTSSRTITVRATDSAGNMGYGDIVVSITDVNEQPVFFVVTETIEGVVPELSPVNTKVGGRITANDPDGAQTLSFSIDVGTGSDYFAIGSSTGQVTVAKTLPDASTSFTLTIRVTDNGSPAQSNTIPMEITLTDTNRPPVIEDASRSIREDAYLNQAVGAKLTATDPDTGETATLEFSLSLDGNPGGAFSIGASDGQLRVANADALDFETRSTYTLLVTVTDSPVSSDPTKPAPPSLSDTATITVTITNANEAPALADVELSIAENSGVGSAVGSKLVGTDVDAGDAASLTYSISSTPTRDDGGVFRITSNGQVEVALAKLDYEKRQLYTFGVLVSDNDPIDPKTSVGLVTIKVLDVNEAPTLPILAAIEVPETTASRSFVGASVRASDQDGDTLSYTLDPASSDFSINSVTGQLQLTTTLDHESKESYSLTVKVSDGEYADTASLTVVVLDVNEHPTLSTTPATVNENTASDIKVATVTVTDQDAGDSVRSFSITAGNEGDAFKIDANGNVLTKTRAALNWELLPSFTLTVVATDSGGLSGSAELSITVLDRPEPPTLTPLTASVDENSIAGVTVAALTVSDEDTDESHSFEIVGGSSHFVVSGNLIKTTSTATDYETRKQYRLTIKVTDKDGLTDTADATINVLNVNEAPTLAAGSRSIDENSAALTQVGAPIQGSDPDEFQVLTYSLVGHSEGIFKIDACSGQLQVAKPVLDYESKSTYTLTIKAKDDGTPTNLFVTAEYTITVNDVNEAPIMRSDYTLTINENSAKDAAVSDVLEASDPDSDTLTYAIVDGDPDGAFKISSADNKGTITVARPILDFEVLPNVYKLTVTVTDDGVGFMSTSVPVTVLLTDVNEAPQFMPTTVSVPENSGVGTLVGVPLACSDVDTPATSTPLTYSIVTADMPFKVDAESGQLSVTDASVLDHETKSSWTFTAQCVDDHPTNPLSDTTTITVIVSDVNEAPTLADGTRNVAENSAIGVAVGDPVSGDDVDGGQSLTYRITSQSVEGIFRIDALTGQIEVSSPSLNYEVEPRTYDLRIEARDNGAGQLTASATYTIYTTDAREPPVMPVGEVREVMENSPTDTSIGGAIRAFDPDAGNTVTYQITGGDDGGLFRISADGSLYVAKDALDYETRASYKIDVTAKDNTGLTSAATAVTINIRDTNEAPTFTASSFDFSVAEDASEGVTIGSAVAADVDAGDTLTYSIVSSDAGSRFVIDSATGAVKVGAGATLALTTYTLSVRVEDAAGLFGSTTVVVTVVDKNDAPVINDATRSVAENSAAGTVVGAPVVGTDVDTEQTLSYAIVDGNHNDVFKVDAATGQLSVQHPESLNFEARGVYRLKLRAIDNGPGTLSDTCTVTVNVVDVQEPPVMHAGVFEVVEMSVVGTVVQGSDGAPSVVTASDPDAADDGELKFRIVSGDDGKFQVNEATGQLTVKSDSLNYELKSKYTLNMEVRDSAGNTATANAVVSILDDNDAPVLHDASRVIAENSPAGSLVGEVLSARDEDVSQSITFTIIDGNTNGDGSGKQPFDITPSGQIVVKDASQVNHEAKASYVLTVKAEDDGGGRPTRFDTAKVSITVEDVNEVPVFSASTYALNINENTPAGTFLTGDSVLASDVDDGQRLTYSIAGGSEVFTINPVTAQLTLQAGASLNHELKSTYTLEVLATDDGTPPKQSTAAVVTVNVVDVNEAPVIDDAVRHVDENVAVDTVVGTPLPATDVDDGQTLTYAIVSPPGFAVFSIQPATGQLLVKTATLDHETTDSYTITVRVTDMATGGLHDDATVVIMVNDINEQPQIDDATREVNENSIDGTPIGDALPASDVDEGQLLIYTIESGNVGGRFKIDPCNGQLMVAKELFNYEDQQTYTLTVKVVDNGDPQLGDTASITVNLLDVNEHPELRDVAISVNENLAEDTEFGSPVVGTDVDAGQTLSYAILSGNDDDLFQIDATSGQLSVAEASIDYERRSTYALTVQATDNGTPALSTTAVARITVKDLNEHPVFSDASRSIEENVGANVPVGLPVTGTDVDARTTLSYRLATTGSPFNIHPNTGQITVANPVLDYESGTNVYSLIAAVSDGELETLATITISLIDVNEAPTMPATSRSVNENSPALTTVGAPVQGVDVDAGQKLTYFIVGGNTDEAFFIDRDNGQVSVRASGLNHEAQDQYLLQVQVVDNGAGALRSTGIVTVSVLDVNDSPTFPATSRRAILENVVDGTPAGTPVQGDDEDRLDEITYSITGGTGRDTFTVEAETGLLRYAAPAPLDFESTPELTVQIKATDKAGASASGLVTVSLVDVNEAPTTPLVQERSVREKVPVDTLVGAVLAVSDVDAGDSHEFAIIGGNSAGHFKLKGTTGQLLVAGSLDNQIQSLYTLTVRVVDSGFMSATTTVNINVFDQNDPPVMTDRVFTIAENTAVNTNVGTPVTGVDPEGQTLTYSITANNVDDTFAIDSATGQLRVAKNILDFETRTTYALIVQAQDDGLGKMTGSCTVTVNVQDKNEAPVIANGVVRDVQENVAVGTLVGAPVAGSDVDANAAGQLTYEFLPRSTVFQIDPATAQISVLSPNLDYEVESSYDLTVKVTDHGFPQLSAEATITVRIGDVNDRPNLDDVTITTPENLKKGDKVGAALVGKDQDRSSYLTYALTGANCWASSSGNIRFAYKFIDQPMPAAIEGTFRVKAADNALFGLFVDPANFDNMYEITISNSVTTISKGSRAPPVADATTTDLLSATEHRQFWYRVTGGVVELGAGNLVGTGAIVSYVDATPLTPTHIGVSTAFQEADFTSVCFDLGSQLTAADMFDIQVGSGQITMRRDGLNYEAVRSYSFEVTTTDDGAGSLTDTAIVRVDVTDENEAPVFVDDCPSKAAVVGCFTVDENSGVGTAVASTNGGAAYANGVFGHDPDVLDGQTVTYALLPTGNVDGAFAIDAATGAITVAADVLNHEGATPEYHLTVAVTDSFEDDPIETRASIIVTVADINEAPVIEDTERHVRESTETPASIDDNSSVVGTTVGAPLPSTDVDDPTLDIGKRTYAIVGGDTDDVFTINAITGQISLAKMTPNYEDEEANRWELTVEVTDLGGLSDTATITIVVDDVNEPPVIEAATRSIAENSDEGTLIGLPLPASDPDLGQTLTYAITDGEGRGVFKISPCSGQLEVLKPLNYEEQNSYTMVVTVTDDGADPARLTDSAIVTVNIVDINEQPFIAPATRNIDENSPVNAQVGDAIPASDPDTRRPDVLTYTIEGGNDLGYFAIDSSTGTITVAEAKLDYETRTKYNLLVRVTDDGEGNLFHSGTVTININDVNEAPVLDDTTLTIRENVAATTTVGLPLQAVDVEVLAGRQFLTYQILSGNDAQRFTIDAASGQISVAKAELDYEDTAQYTLVVEVVDSGHNHLKDTASITIDILDVNERPTVVEATMTLAEDEVLGQAVGTVVATDPEARDMVFKITAGDENKVFAIDNDGALTVRNPAIDFETQPVYSLTVQVTDAGDATGGNKLTDSATVVVQILNVNEPPSMPTFTRSVEENSAPGTAVGVRVFGDDVDVSTADAESLTYALANPDGSSFFAIDAATGQITVDAAGLNFEVQSAYTVQVTATDAGGLSATAATTINILDVNEAPTVTVPGVFAAHEQAENGASVCFENLCAAVGNDVDAGDAITFAITGAQACPDVDTLTGCVDAAGVFAIDAITGAVTVADNSMDEFRSPTGMRLSVQVTDRAGLTGTTELVVEMSNVNLPPVLARHAVSVNENTAPMFDIPGVIEAVDTDVSDSGEFDVLTYSILSVSPESGTPLFALKPLPGVGNGGATQLQVVAAGLDHEANAVYTVQIGVSDSGVPSRGTNNVVEVTVVDVNEPPVVSAQARSVAENSPAGTPLGAPVVATDFDDGDVLTYAIALSGADAGSASPFVIDSATGQVTVADSATLDFETKTAYTYTLSVSDGDSTVTADFDVTVENVNEQPAIAAQTFTVDENSARDVSVGTVVATDEDAQSIAVSLSYFLSVSDPTTNNADELFQIDRDTGEITVRRADLDFERQESYTMTITVKDDWPAAPMSNSATVTIHLVDVNDLTVTGFSLGSPVAEPNVEFPTVGGTWVTLIGTNFGKTVAPADAADNPTIVARYQSIVDGIAFGPVYTSPECLITSANTRISCKTAEGVGAFLQWTLTVGPWTTISQTADGTPVTTSYQAPVVDSVAGADALRTVGGDSFTLTGSNFGPAGTNPVRVRYTASGYESTVRLTATECEVVGDGHDTITCKSAVGVGHDLTFTATLPDTRARRTSQPKATAAKYADPTILGISIVDGDSIGQLDTVGGNRVELRGSNFGPKWAKHVVATYGPGGSGFTAAACVVVEDDTKVQCTTTEGIGSSHRWVVSIAGVSSAMSTVLTSYKRPVVTSLSGAGYLSADTKGGQPIYLTGSQFGPMGTSANALGVSFYGPPVAVYGGDVGNNNPRFFAVDCQVSAAHTQIRCLTAPGTGKDHAWRVTVGAQNSDVLEAEMSYAPPVIVAFTNEGAESALTPGGQVVVIEGRQFGFDSAMIDAVTYGVDSKEFDATPQCTILEAHRRIECQTTEGAGAALKWLVIIDGQESGAPTTNYKEPSITSISGAGATDASTNGGQEVFIHGANFGPSTKPEFLEALSFGPSATQYSITSDCAVQDHDTIRCVTAPGVGASLAWQVTIKGQTSAAIPAEARTNFAPPAITHMSITSGVTDGGYLATVTGSNFGFVTALAKRTSKVAVRWNGVDLDELDLRSKVYVDPDTGGLVTPDSTGMVPTDTLHRLSFVVPEATEFGATRTVQIVVTDQEGTEVVSDAHTFTYEDPAITHVIPENNRVTGLKELRIEGSNFGVDGTATVTDAGGNVLDLSCTFDDGRGFMWTHNAITCLYDGIKGSVVVTRGGQTSNSLSFEHRAPQISALASAATPSSLKFFLTEGGEDVTIQGYDIAKDAKDINITVAGAPCPIVGDITAVAKDGDEIVTVRCAMPPGQGRDQPMRVSSHGQASAQYLVNYDSPFISDVVPRELPTHGNTSLTLFGWNFGVRGQTAFLVKDSGATELAMDCEWHHRRADCTAPEGAGADYYVRVQLDAGGGSFRYDEPYGRYEYKDAYDAYNTALPPGAVPVVFSVNTCPDAGVAVPNSQRVCNGREDGMRVPFKFANPEVTGIDMPANAHTQGGYSFTIHGNNFGHEFADVQVELRDQRFGRRLATPSSGAASTPLEVQSHTHTSVVVVMPPAAGGESLIPVITVNGQQSAIPAAGSPAAASYPSFTFDLPQVHDVFPPTANTSAVDSAGNAVVLNVTGANLGTSGEVRLYTDPAGADGGATFVVLPVVAWTHEWVACELVPGYGINRHIVLEVAGQTTTDDVRFDFAAPEILSLTPDTSSFDLKSARFPTHGGYEVSIAGNSFGTTAGVVTVAGAPATLVSQTHNLIVFTMPAGIGRDLRVVVKVGASSESHPFWVSYDPPRIDNINPYPADAEGETIEIMGANFGAPGTSSRLQVVINDDNCTDAVVIQGPDGADDFISCKLPRQPVGFKNITLSVALQEVSYTNARKLQTQCKPGFYGQRGEHCLPCPRGATCTGGDHPTFYEMEAEPISDDGWWLKNVSDEISLCPEERLQTRQWLNGQLAPHCPHALPCEPKSACNGSNTCNLGYTGERCSLCALRYYRRAGECVECPDNPLILIGAFLATAICLMIGGYFLNKKSVNLAFVSIGVDYFQILALFANSRVEWPPFIKDLFHMMSVFNFNLEITAPECSIPDLGYKTKWLFIMALPLAATVMFLVAHVAQWSKKRFVQGRRKKLNSHVNLLVATFMVMFYYMYLYLTRTSLEIFNCAPTDPPDGHEYLEVVFERCDEPGGIHQTLLPLAICTFFAYTIGYPLVLSIVLWRNRELVMEDQLLRAMEVGNTRLTNPNAYDLRKRYHKMYYHFRPDFWYWILVIIARKFLIAFTALMFNKNPAFQLSMALLVMFGSYALQVRNTPYMSMSEHGDVVRHHQHKVEDGDQRHVRLAGVVAEVAQRGKRKTRGFSWQNPSASNAASAAASFFWNYNTVEAVLLACAVLINLAGIMFESGRFDSEYYSTQRDFITVCVMIIVFFSLVYFATVLLSEMYSTFCSKPKVETAKERRTRRASTMGGEMDLVSMANPMQAANKGSVSTELNPMFLNSTRNADQAAAHTDTLLASTNAPNEAEWKVIRTQYKIQAAELKTAKQQLQKFEDAGGVEALRAVAKSKKRTVVKNQFDSMRSDRSRGGSGASSADSAAARRAARRMVRRQSGKGAALRARLAKRQAQRRGSVTSVDSAVSYGSHGGDSSGMFDSGRSLVSGASAASPGSPRSAAAGGTISNDEWNALTPEQQAERRKAYEDWQRQYGQHE